jgi:hypothetical protein
MSNGTSFSGGTDPVDPSDPLPSFSRRLFGRTGFGRARRMEEPGSQNSSSQSGSSNSCQPPPPPAPCSKQASATAAPYLNASQATLPSTMNVAGTAALSGGLTAVARATGLPPWAQGVTFVLGALAPFAESSANFVTGVAVYSFTYAGCTGASGPAGPPASY